MNETYLRVVVILMIFFGASVKICHGQTQDNNLENYFTKESWEVGTDLLWLIDKNQLPANNLFFRRNYTAKQGTRHAWRLRLGVDISLRDSVNINDPIDNELNETYLLILLGHEWQYLVDKKALLYFGGDAQFSYDRRYENRILSLIDPPPSGSLYQETRTIYIPGVIGFLGARYHPRPWVAISLESNLEILYRIRRNPSKVTQIETPDVRGGRDLRDSESVIIRILPISILTISFHF